MFFMSDAVVFRRDKGCCSLAPPDRADHVTVEEDVLAVLGFDHVARDEAAVFCSLRFDLQEVRFPSLFRCLLFPDARLSSVSLQLFAHASSSRVKMKLAARPVRVTLPSYSAGFCAYLASPSCIRTVVEGRTPHPFKACAEHLTV